MSKVHDLEFRETRPVLQEACLMTRDARRVLGPQWETAGAMAICDDAKAGVWQGIRDKGKNDERAGEHTGVLRAESLDWAPRPTRS